MDSSIGDPGQVEHLDRGADVVGKETENGGRRGMILRMGRDPLVDRIAWRLFIGSSTIIKARLREGELIPHRFAVDIQFQHPVTVVTWVQVFRHWIPTWRRIVWSFQIALQTPAWLSFCIDGRWRPPIAIGWHSRRFEPRQIIFAIRGVQA
ncbi:MAG: hypothetical protein R3F54_28835 [Alphaproteobacteria bacterium]